MTTPRTTRKKAPKPTPPKLVDLARWLFILGAVIGMGRFLYQLSDREMLIRELRAQQPNLGQDELDAAATGGIVFGLLLAALLVLVYALLANRMAWGRNWARVALTVFTAASVFFGVVRLIAVTSGFASAFGLAVSPVDLAFSAVTMIVDAIAVVLVFRPSSAPWFRPRPPVAAPAPQVTDEYRTG